MSKTRLHGSLVNDEANIPFVFETVEPSRFWKVVGILWYTGRKVLMKKLVVDGDDVEITMWNGDHHSFTKGRYTVTYVPLPQMQNLRLLEFSVAGKSVMRIQEDLNIFESREQFDEVHRSTQCRRSLAT